MKKKVRNILTKKPVCPHCGAINDERFEIDTTDKAMVVSACSSCLKEYEVRLSFTTKIVESGYSVRHTDKRKEAWRIKNATLD